MTQVLIMGASGGIGRHALHQALALGHKVRAFAQRADSIDIAHANLANRKGDALAEADVAAALDGINVVIQALGVAAHPGIVLKPVRLFSGATRILIPAMKQAGVRRLVSVTGFGAADSRSKIGCLQRTPLRMFLGHAYDDKDIQEKLIRTSSLDWVVVRPVVLTNGRFIDRYRVLVEPESWRNGFISRADVANFLVRQIEDETFLGKTPVLIY